jgi:protein-disulfide isomerase
MQNLMRLLAAFILIGFAPLAASADEGYYPIKADDGSVVANHRVPVELESQIEKLPGVVVVGNPRGEVTLNEFYDVNCPFCRKASADIDVLLRGNPELKLVLVPFPVLGIPSIQGTRVELAVQRLVPPQKFYEFHRALDASRGVVDGNRALAAAQATGLDPAQVLKIGNEDSLADVMKAHVHLGDALGIEATPGLVIKGVAFVGYPGPKALAGIIDAVQRCDAVTCDITR